MTNTTINAVRLAQSSISSEAAQPPERPHRTAAVEPGLQPQERERDRREEEDHAAGIIAGIGVGAGEKRTDQREKTEQHEFAPAGDPGAGPRHARLRAAHGSRPRRNKTAARRDGRRQHDFARRLGQPFRQGRFIP